MSGGSSGQDCGFSVGGRAGPGSRALAMSVVMIVWVRPGFPPCA